MPAGSNGTMEVKTQACFSISIIVVGFISGIHYCLIGLIRKRHDCITNSTRACQDGFISIPVLFLEKHLVISVWWNYCAQPFIDLRCKTSRLPICNNKPPSAAQPLQAQHGSQCKNDSCSFWVEPSEAEIKQERGNERGFGTFISLLNVSAAYVIATVLQIKGESFPYTLKVHSIPSRYSFMVARDDNKTRHDSR